MNRLKDLREENDLKQSDLSKLLNIDRTTYSNYETEDINISTDKLCKLADYYKVSIDYLLYNTDERTVHKLTNRLMQNRLKDIRINNKLTQAKIGNAIGMSQNGYLKYEKFQADVPIIILIRLSKYYNTSIDYILCRTDDFNPYNNSKI